MTAPETIWAIPAIGGGWDDEMGMWAKTSTGIEGQAEYILKSKADALIASAYEAAVQTVDTLGDSAVTDALGARLCCNGDMCGCQGATVEEYILHHIRALTPPDAQAALQAMIDAAVKEAREKDAAEISKALTYYNNNPHSHPQNTIAVFRECLTKIGGAA